MRPGNPRDFLIVLVWSLASIAVALVIWLGPLAYAIGRLGIVRDPWEGER